MHELSPSYLSELATQIGFLSAFLGGIAATMLAMLLQAERRASSDVWAISASALSATSFIVSVIGCTQLIATLHPDAPAMVSNEGAETFARLVAFLAFGVGVYALLAVVALAGWRHSPRAGWITSGTALAGACILSLMLVGG